MCHFWVCVIADIIEKIDIRARFTYIPTTLNVVSDLLSRGGVVCEPSPITLDRDVLQ